MYITDSDYRPVIGTQALDAISRVDPDIRRAAEEAAIDEARAYLTAFDTQAIFEATGSDRQPRLVLCCVDIALYHMSASLPARMGSEVRQQRYNEALRWLADVRDGRIEAALPKAEGNASGGTIARYGSADRISFAW